MRPDKTLAVHLRRRGKSYNEISRGLGIPKSTLSTWFRHLKLPLSTVNDLYDRSRSAGTRALVARNKRQTALARLRADVMRHTAAQEIGHVASDQLRLLGVALYWAEGTKRHRDGMGKRVAFSNADPAAVQLMMRFFRENCGVPEGKFRAQVNIPPGINDEQAVRFWSQVTRIPTQQFTKSCQMVSRSSKGKRPRSRLPHGTLQIRIADTALFHRIMGWIGGVQQATGGDGSVLNSDGERCLHRSAS